MGSHMAFGAAVLLTAQWRPRSTRSAEGAQGVFLSCQLSECWGGAEGCRAPGAHSVWLWCERFACDARQSWSYQRFCEYFVWVMFLFCFPLLMLAGRA